MENYREYRMNPTATQYERWNVTYVDPKSHFLNFGLTRPAWLALRERQRTDGEWYAFQGYEFPTQDEAEAFVKAQTA